MGRILYGITGGIAAYKAPLLIREFQKLGHEIKTVPTKNALQFVTPTVLTSLTGQPVYSDTFEEEREFGHITLGRWGDLLLVAPATANIISKFAWGVADDLLSTLFVSFKHTVVIAPAMNHDMWAADQIRKNTHLLAERGVRVIPPGKGELACGDEGYGRMADIETIVEHTCACFTERTALEGRRVVVTAGATREHIDPVRFISNRSSGKMGFAVASAFHRRGAAVTLITGPTDIVAPYEIDVVRVTSAEQMFNAVSSAAPQADVIVKAAAVADYTPAAVSEHKVKKTDGPKTIELVRTQDILKHLGDNKRPGQILVGFSAETENHLENAAGKLRRKNLDMIVLNDVRSADAGFEVDTNRILIITPGEVPAEDAAAAKPAHEGTTYGKTIDGMPVVVRALPLMSKLRAADEIARCVIGLLPQ